MTLRDASFSALGVAFLTVVGGCADGTYLLNLMPAPDVYDSGALDPFVATGFVSEAPNPTILYATDRQLAAAGEGPYYSDRRGNILRVGAAHVTIGAIGTTWEDARKVSLLKSRAKDYPLQVSGIDEFGVIGRTLTPWLDPAAADPGPAARFVDEINSRMAQTQARDVFIYVHGYKVTFENPLLVGAELWHFLGYKGAFIAYSWPSTPSRLAYVADVEDAALTARNLRELILFIADQTDVERIHVIGYSAGTRAVARALADLALLCQLLPPEDRPLRTKLANVVLIGSDVDRDAVGGYLADGLASVTRRLTVYLSGGDNALGVSRFVLRQQRLGQLPDPGTTITPLEARFLADAPGFNLINVSEAAESTSGNGHGYFRRSPWVSSDLFITLLFDLSPGLRGLVQRGEAPVWAFPPDYPERVRSFCAHDRCGR